MESTFIFNGPIKQNIVLPKKKKLLDYIQSQYKANCKVIHLYVGSKIMKRKWKVVPFELSTYDDVELLNNLSILLLKLNMSVIVYNDTIRNISLNDNFIIKKINNSNF
ncbi:hypothetical protein PmNV_092 [Penaeus monodon nudivirus]|uniref:Uncharacterized protein n=1 Tax=Penaeus monodon nudivirus TaxID=1529056 RepID=A0A076FE22_9VIRU|nr:hypothetical protein PmNV_092 [Penaeus monodon nudivirus]AII15880.1 hypothetical protein PmNV_092 [Penaeus monodon nudivirus]